MTQKSTHDRNGDEIRLGDRVSFELHGLTQHMVVTSITHHDHKPALIGVIQIHVPASEVARDLRRGIERRDETAQTDADRKRESQIRDQAAGKSTTTTTSPAQPERPTTTKEKTHGK